MYETNVTILNIGEEKQRYGRDKSTMISHAYINSGIYRRKFDEISKIPELNRLLYQLSKKMLEHRSGTKYEDMYWIDPTSISVIAEETNSNLEGKIIYTDSIMSKIGKYKGLVTLHSHPNSLPPSINDLNSNYHNHYDTGIIVCHDGKLFKYSSGEEISESYYKLKVEKYLKNSYNEFEAQIRALEELQLKFDIQVREVTGYDI